MNEPTVRRALGLAPSEAFTRLARAIADHDAPGALALAASLASEGADLRRFVGDAIEFFRGVFLARYAPKLEEIVEEMADRIAPGLIAAGWRATRRPCTSPGPTRWRRCSTPRAAPAPPRRQRSAR